MRLHTLFHQPLCQLHGDELSPVVTSQQAVALYLHLHPHLGRVMLPRRRARRSHEADCRLAAGESHASIPDQQRARDRPSEPSEVRRWSNDCTLRKGRTARVLRAHKTACPGRHRSNKQRTYGNGARRHPGGARDLHNYDRTDQTPRLADTATNGTCSRRPYRLVQRALTASCIQRSVRHSRSSPSATN